MPVKKSITPPELPREWAALAPMVSAMADLFEHVPDAVFFVKDRGGRYVAVNESLVKRCGLRHKSELIGRLVGDLFPGDLGRLPTAQDHAVLRSGQPIYDHLELHWYARGRSGWCLTTKLPLRDAVGNIVGLVGISRDLRAPSDAGRIPPGLGAALEHLENAYAEPLSPAGLAKKAGLSPVRFARHIKRIFRLTPSQLITQTRLAAASRLLAETDDSIAAVGQACGFYDHSAFSRVFKQATGLTPMAFRSRERGAGLNDL